VPKPGVKSPRPAFEEKRGIKKRDRKREREEREK